MNVPRSLLLALLLALAGSASAVPGVPATRSQAAAAWSEDGLEKVKIRGLDVAFSRPGSSLAPYDKVLLRPVSVAFRRNWGRSAHDGPGRVRAEDAQRIKDRLAQLVAEELAAEFKAGGYALVEQPADDVLELEVRITDLYIVAPDVPTVGRSEVFAVSPGEMTLIADLRDSASGETVMRIYDHEDGDHGMRMRRITNIENAAEATRLARGWAQALRRQLDAARADSRP